MTLDLNCDYRGFKGPNIRYCVVGDDNTLLSEAPTFKKAERQALKAQAPRITLQSKHKKYGWQNVRHFYS